MSMNIKYVNSNGQSVNLNQYPYKMLISDILDSEPDVIENNGYSEIYTSYYWCTIYIGDKEYDVYFK